MKIDYEKSFKKLVEQINFEYGLAEENRERATKTTGKGSPFDNGMVFAYGSIKELADKLENGTFAFEREGEETTIEDRMGYYTDGYLCNDDCVGCPYVVKDVDGNDACYSDTYHNICPMYLDYEEE